ncbi:MAG TPA: efflux RND transporter periplasmic adaptor subunit [Candidatus Polarisedimenticolaceae bacterium]
MRSTFGTGIRPLAATFALAAALTLTACGSTPEPREAAARAVSGMSVETARLATLPDERQAPGVVRSVATATLSARTTGTAIEVRAREGAPVRRGQLLARLDERELEAGRSAALAALRETEAGREEATRGVAAARAQAELMEKTHARFLFLRDRDSVSPQEFDEAEARHRSAQAQLAAAQARRRQAEATYARVESEARAAETVASYARVTAPFDGVVVRRYVEPGTMVTPGMPLFVVEDTSRYRIEVTVDASDARSAEPGARARVRIDTQPAVELDGTIVEVEAGADPGTQTVRARIDLPRHPALRSGLFGRAWLRRGERHVLAVPRESVVERGQLRGVYVVDSEQLAHWRLVTLGDAIGEGFEVLSGFGEGERYVVEPAGRDLGGTRIDTALARAEDRP